MSAGERRVGARGWVAWGLAAAMALEPATAAASAAIATTGAMVAPTVPHALYKKKKKKKAKKKVEGPAKIGPEVTIESANTKREAIRAAAKGDADAGNFAAAAKTLEDNGAILGDPVVYLEAADLRLKAAEKDRDIDQAEMAIESSRVAADISGYYEAVAAGSAESAWMVIDPSTASDLSSRAADTIARGEKLIEELEEEKENAGASVASGPSDKPKRERKKRKKGDMKPGTGLIAAGSGMLVVGAAGVSMAIAGLVISSRKQKEVEDLVLPMDQAEVDKLDDEGNRANTIAIAGAVVAAVGVGVGIPLVVIGVKRRKQANAAPASASLRLVPRLSRGSAGLAITGRF
jgi:hypothetical protein